MSYVTDIERRRHELSRCYEMLGEARLYRYGHRARPSFFERVKNKVEFHFLTHYMSALPNWRVHIRRFGGRRTVPDFFVIGPMKSGSSDLATTILLHPNVMTPLVKELPVRAADPNAWRLYYPTEAQKREHARRHGLALSPYLSPYMHFMELAHYVSRTLPKAKIVITLRDPVERVYSHWKWDVLLSGRSRAGELPFLETFEAYVSKALEVFPDYPMYTTLAWAPPLQTSIYWNAVRHWIEACGAENVLVLDVGDYFRDREGFVKTVFEFVGLPPVELPRLGGVINENPLKFPPPDAATNAKLKAFFAPRNEKLYEIIGKRFDW